MKNIIRKLSPNFFPSVHILMARVYDTIRFIRSASSVSTVKNKHKLAAMITRQYHGIEKGFSLNVTKRPFGFKLVNTLLVNMNIYIATYGRDSLINHAIRVLGAYFEFHEGISDESLYKMKMTYSKISTEKNSDRPTESEMPIRRIKLENIKRENNFNFHAWIRNRRSVRDFNGETVDKALIEAAILDAMESPSACNRQGWKVRIFSGHSKDIALNNQNGNASFRSGIDKVILVTGDNRKYSYTERNGSIIDGALFAMSLIYALHARSIGTCPLNTSYILKDELKARKDLGVPDYEEFIMMIALGGLKDEFNVALSPRESIESVIVNDIIDTNEAL